MKNKPLWQKILIWSDMACVITALIALTAEILMGATENDTYMILRFVSRALMGVHFVLHGILNWKEQRGLAIFELSAVAFVLVFAISLIFLPINILHYGRERIVTVPHAYHRQYFKKVLTKQL